MNFADEQLRGLLQRDWAVRVLDAWATNGHRHYSRGYDIRLGVAREPICQTRSQGYSTNHRGDTLEAARIAAAEAVFGSLPEAIRAEIGEKP